MPNNGLIIAWDKLEYRLAGSATATGAGGTLSYGYAGSGYTRWAPDTVNSPTGIELYVESDWNGTSGTWEVTYRGPNEPSGGYTVSGSGYQATSIVARFINLKIYSKLTGALYRVMWDSIEIYVNGSLSTTLGSGDETSYGVGPCYLNYIGVPFQIQGSATGGVDTSWAYDPCDPSDVASGNWNYNVPAVIEGGWRFEDDGGTSWQALPVYVDVRTVAGTGCPFGLTATGIVSAADTYSGTVNVTAKGSQVLEYIGRTMGVGYTRVECEDGFGNVIATADLLMVEPCLDLCDSSATDPYRDYYRTTLTNEPAGGSIMLLPNLEKDIFKLGNSDYKSLIYRNDFPEVRGSASRTCTIDAVTTSASSTPQIYPGSAAFLGGVGLGTHPMEDFLALDTVAPVTISKSKTELKSISFYGNTVCSTYAPSNPLVVAVCPSAPIRIISPIEVFPTAPTGSNKEEAIGWTSINFVDTMANYQSHASMILRYVGSWGNPLWHYFHFKDDFSSLVFADYWGPGRQQWLGNSSLPTAEKTFTRTDILGSCFDDSGHTVFMDTATTHRWLGTSRQRLYSPTIPASCQTGATAVWNFGVYDSGTNTWDGTGTVGATTVTVGTTTTKATLDALSFTAYPFMYPLICDRIEIPATGFTNVASFSVKLIGIDGSEVELCTASGTHVIPKGANVKYAGSWGIENSPDPGVTPDLGVDATGDGISTTVMGDPLHCPAFSLLPARSYYRLRYDIVKTNAALTATVPNPIFKRNATTPKMYWESGHIQTLLWPNGSALRLGNWTFYDTTLGLMNPPVVLGNAKTTIIDALCSIRLIFEARAHNDGLTTELTTLFDTYEGQSVGVVDKFSCAWINPAEGDHSTVSSYQWSLVNTMAESPPLMCFPNKSFVVASASWAQTGTYKHQAIDWSQEARHLIHPTNRMDQEDATGPGLITSPTTAPLGWAITTHQVAVDNTETATWDINIGATKYADATPWRGWFGILEILESDGVAYAVGLNLRHAVAYVQGGTAWLGIADHANLSSIAFSDTGIAAETVFLEWVNGGANELNLYVSDAGSCERHRTKNEGVSFTMTTIGNGSQVAAVCAPDNLEYTYRVDGGAILGKIYDAMGNVIDTFTAVASGVDDAQIGVDCQYNVPGGVPGGLRFTLYYMVSGSVTSKSSQDGRVFA
jgi:hypothetical protein